MGFFMQNFGTILVTALIVIAVGLILRSMRNDKKNGKSTCGCDCGSCGGCHSCGSTVKK